MTQTDLIQRLTAGLPITAGSFIVTVYGDVVVPRGERSRGVLRWGAVVSASCGR